MRSFNSLIIYASCLWLGSAIWLANQGDPIWIWMGIIPATYVALLTLLRD